MPASTDHFHCWRLTAVSPRPAPADSCAVTWSSSSSLTDGPGPASSAAPRARIGRIETYYAKRLDAALSPVQDPPGDVAEPGRVRLVPVPVGHCGTGEGKPRIRSDRRRFPSLGVRARSAKVHRGGGPRSD